MIKRNTLMRRTVALVLTSLLASTIFTVASFSIAGRSSEFTNHAHSSFDQANEILDLLNRSEENNYLFSRYICGNTSVTGGTYIYVMNENGSIALPDSGLYSPEVQEHIEYARENFITNSDEEISQNYKEFTDDNGNIDSVLIVNRIEEGYYAGKYEVVIADLKGRNEIINHYINVLILSNLAVALTMLLPVVLVVNRITEPIINVNKVAKEYGHGNYEIRADESYTGEGGELAVSFNLMADKLSKSISELTRERNRLEDIFNVTSEGIVVFNENGDPGVMNDTMNTIFSKVPKKNLFTERLHVIPFDEVWEDVEKCLSQGEQVERTLEGPDYVIKETLIPKMDGNDPTKCVGATGFFRDITEDSKLERTRRDYVANISHELRTPLQTLRGLIEPLADGMVKKEEDKLRYYNIILNETLRLSRLIDDMLELSKLQSRTLAFKMFPFDLNSLLNDLETKFIPVMNDAKIKFRVMFNTGDLPTVMGNPDRVEQILVILLDNAKKYTAEGGSITISAEYNDIVDKVFISVIDTGQGIHEYDINHIFDRFFKADRARGKKGTGLGLAIAKELLTYMGEDITVQSEYGHGTTFTFTLKRAEASNNWY
ncbi:two-component system, OmpR family, sensor histidine kinase ResE/two-component system, OmpR family, sensor histidine kinase VicK [Ruminococcaceae bacterium KH2T8]|nr:two-component system, OmpR family, sensor histidine kinase ResE/two-component system, OmpR family, sensor histidine kinase VicK [Ruminococcaceae bacterium KH2T8]